MTKTDKLIFWGVLILSFFGLLFSNVIFANDGEKKVVIEVDAKTYATYRMQAMKETKEVEIKTEYACHTVEITKDSVRVVSADCKNKACLGEIEKTGEMLVCLPGRLVIKITGEQEVDGVAY